MKSPPVPPPSPDPARSQRPSLLTTLKRAVFVLILAGTLLAGAAAVFVTAQGFARVNRVQNQADALNFARRSEPVTSLRWQPAPPGVRVPDGVTLEDIADAYLLGHSELTYAGRSGEQIGLNGRFSGPALTLALTVSAQPDRVLLLDWAHQATPLDYAADGTRFTLRDRFWLLEARPSPDGLKDLRWTVRTQQVTLRRTQEEWRTDDWAVLNDAQPTLTPPPPLPVRTWRAVTLPDDWHLWPGPRWKATLRAAHAAGLRQVTLPMSAILSRQQVAAIADALAGLHAAGLQGVVSIDGPLTLDNLQTRLAIASASAGADAFVPGSVAAASLDTRAALLSLRMTHPDLQLLAPVSGTEPAQPPTQPLTRSPGALPPLTDLLSARVQTAAPGAQAPAAPQVLLDVPAVKGLPLPLPIPVPGAQAAHEAAQADAAWRGGWNAGLLEEVLVIDPDSGLPVQTPQRPFTLTPAGEQLLGTPAPAGETP
ncbi:hypothetical protein GCM10008959_19650 [Deinococcus seoulensis]|uniref:DUF2125 domain-containing protein n=1 Tax=Deinococcus seoulensis TaxID=1837379 RepID=A0ABQ2RSS0_9DEIO|nr:hypothetical protein [Deinococcus seoulensis]GGR58003.1 hypothetical protein GCM10008959_19650 [Deinococcus seoulensis]